MKIPMLSDYPLDELAPPPHHSSCPCSNPDTLWPETRGPAAELEKERRGWRRWLDHRWRARMDDGTIVYVVEPYDMDNESIEDMHWLIEHGWTIRISAARAHHYPGATTAVMMTKGDTQAGTSSE